MIFDVVYLILAGILPGLLLCGAAPATRDESQTGEYNVDAKFDNILILIAPSSGIISGITGYVTDLASGALAFKHASRSSVANEKPKEPNEAVVYETEEVNHGREPYRVEIIRIEKEGENSGKRNVDKANNLSVENSKADSKVSSTNAEKSEGNRNEKEKKARSIWRHEEIRELVDSLEKGRQKEKSVTKKTNKIENLEQSAESLSIKEENLKSTKPGISLKKQLSRKEDEDVSLMSSERNDVEIKPLELKLLGGGIENCGPGRYRDRSGVCQFDKSFN